MAKELLTLNEYQAFHDETIKSRRYIHTSEINKFLFSFRNEIHKNCLRIFSGNEYYRAQKGFCEHIEYNKHIKVPYDKDRMYPLKEEASEGRINPKGIPYLYLTEIDDNALYEIGANYKSYISLSKFQLARTLDVIYFHKKMEYLYYPSMSNDSEVSFDLPVWNEINKAFSKPIYNTDRTAEYVPTQVFAEIIKDEKYDGILYMSQYYDCYNLLLI